MTQADIRAMIIHLRIPFSFFLLPIFLFSLAATTNPDEIKAWAAFFILHFLLYPASHAFNSWYDRDQGSIGGVENPPPVPGILWPTIWLLDILTLVAAFTLIGALFGFCLLIYTLGSKLYSWSKTRLKKRPWAGWACVGLVQGGLIFLATSQSLGQPRPWNDPLLWLGTFVAIFFLWSMYPITQIYQHVEDQQRGDRTLSLHLGIRGTFIFSLVFMVLAAGLFAVYYLFTTDLFILSLFLFFQVPSLIFFLFWFYQVLKNPSKADFKHTMKMNLMASSSMSSFLLLTFSLQK